MKSTRILILCLLGLILISSCSITQRRYNKGFNVEWKVFGRKGQEGTVAKRYRQAKPLKQPGMGLNTGREQAELRLKRVPLSFPGTDDDTIIYYKKPKRKRLSQPAGQSDSSRSTVSKTPVKGKVMPEQMNGKRYEKNASAAIILFFLSFAVFFLSFYLLIAAFITAARSRKYFRTYPDSTLKGRGWADFIYYFIIFMMVLSIVVLLFLLLLLVMLV